MNKITHSLVVILVSFSAFYLQSPVAQAGAPVVGKKAAAKYFQKNNRNYSAATPDADQNYVDRYPSSVESLSNQEHYMALGFGTYSSSSVYNWGNGTKQEDVGKWGLDMTYRLTPNSDLFDQVIRVSYVEYKPLGRNASKMSFLYGLTFPDAGSQFPLYFGAAVGPGIFFKQIDEESSIALDYQMFVGLRLFNLFEKTGFFVEAGIRNHLHVLSDGQLNGTFVTAGALFTF